MSTEAVQCKQGSETYLYIMYDTISPHKFFFPLIHAAAAAGYGDRQVLLYPQTSLAQPHFGALVAQGCMNTSYVRQWRWWVEKIHPRRLNEFVVHIAYYITPTEPHTRSLHTNTPHHQPESLPHHTPDFYHTR